MSCGFVIAALLDPRADHDPYRNNDHYKETATHGAVTAVYTATLAPGFAREIACLQGDTHNHLQIGSHISDIYRFQQQTP